MCGFSGQVVQILDHLGVAYKGVNVLESDDIRNGIKAYSNWPTIPQLYVKGEFVGGCDIIREMFQAGELQQALKDKGVPSARPPESRVAALEPRRVIPIAAARQRAFGSGPREPGGLHPPQRQIDDRQHDDDAEQAGTGAEENLVTLSATETT